jgi:hypothetical protein
MQLYECMEDWRRIKWPADDSDLVDERIEPAMREEINAVLRANKVMNAARHLKQGDPRRLIEGQGNLADAIETSQRMVARILGNVDKSKPIKLADTTVFLSRIRKALGIDAIVQVGVRHDRAADLRLVAGLDDAEFRAFIDALKKR